MVNCFIKKKSDPIETSTIMDIFFNISTNWKFTVTNSPPKQTQLPLFRDFGLFPLDYSILCLNYLPWLY